MSKPGGRCILVSVAVLGLISISTKAQSTSPKPKSSGTIDQLSLRMTILRGLSLTPTNRSAGQVFSGLQDLRAMTKSAGSSTPVLGNGTSGQLTKWTGLTTSNSFIGDSIITETKQGNIGIGTFNPGSKLSVQGMIETTLGGFKFPDGTIQTTASTTGLQSVFHDSTLAGNGTSSSPLGVALPLQLDPPFAHPAIIASGSVSGSSGIVSAHNTSNGIGILGTSSGAAGSTGVRGEGDDGVLGIGSSVGVHGKTTATGIGVLGESMSGTAIRAIGGNTGVFSTAVMEAIHGESSNGTGVFGSGRTGVRAIGALEPLINGGVGVLATGGASEAVNGGAGIETSGGQGATLGGPGLSALGGQGGTGKGGDGATVVGGGSDSGPGGDGIQAFAGIGTPRGNAGIFVGDVQISGNLSKSGGSFKIDHPLDPENKYLLHSFVESPDMMNIYNGNVVLDASGEAVVRLPAWFEALNADFRYLLTAIGAPAPSLFIASKISGNQFKIAGGQPGLEVSWQVTGVRRDPWANKHRIPVEEDKPEKERGYFLHPELYRQPEEKNVEWVRHPETMPQLKEKQNRARKRND